MKEQQKISRKDFLAIIAGIFGAAVIAKIFSFEKAANLLASSRHKNGAYSSSYYGGRKP